MVSVPLTLAVAPSKNNPDLKRSLIAADGRKSASQKPSLLFTTEMGEHGEDYRDFLSGLGGNLFRSTKASTGSENPMFYNYGLLEESGGYHREIILRYRRGGRQKYYPGVSPTRTYEINRMYPIDQKTGLAIPELSFVVIGTHFTAFAWSNRFNHQPAKKLWVRDNWNQHWKDIQAEIKKFKAQGDSVIVGGDFNRKVTSMPKWDREQKIIVNGGIDGIFYIPGPNVRLTVMGKQRNVDLPGSDHHLRMIPIRLTA